MPQLSKINYSFDAGKIQQLPLAKAKTVSVQDAALKLGIGVASNQVARDMAMAYAADALQSIVTTASIPNPIQFLQEWLPGVIHIMTAARKIDDLIGIQTVGSWEDEQIVATVAEPLGYAQPYGDLTALPLADFNINYVTRTVVNFEQGMQVGIKEEARVSRERINAGQMKRELCAEDLEVARNLVGFNGYNSGNDNTYGFLNDPGLPAYVTVATGATSGSKLWSQKTYLEIVTDLLTAFATLRSNTKGRVDPKKDPIVLAVPTNAVDYLSTVSQYGNSVREWLSENYPKVRVEDAIQLNTANGGSGVFYIYPERVTDLSTDGGQVWIQAVPAKFMVEGVQKVVKGYKEGYLNATAGAMCKRPICVYRVSGIS